MKSDHIIISCQDLGCPYVRQLTEPSMRLRQPTDGSDIPDKYTHPPTLVLPLHLHPPPSCRNPSKLGGAQVMVLGSTDLDAGRWVQGAPDFETQNRKPGAIVVCFKIKRTPSLRCCIYGTMYLEEASAVKYYSDLFTVSRPSGTVGVTPCEEIPFHTWNFKSHTKAGWA